MFASIHIPDFTVESVVRHQPELRQLAMVVVEAQPPLWPVIGLNALARDAGIEKGMTRLQVEQFFNATIRERSITQEAAAHAGLLDCAAAFSPRVEDTYDDTVTLDIEGLNQLYGSNGEIAGYLAGQVFEIGLTANIGIASNPDAAVCAARGWPGITVIDPGMEAARLSSLRIGILPLQEETRATLLRWGIRSFGALAKLPVKALSERLGQHGVYLHRLASGSASRPLKPRKESLHFVESMELDYSITLLEPLTFILNRLCDSLFNRLRSRGLAALEIHLTLKRERGNDPFVFSLRLPVPARNPRVITRLLMLELESHPPGAPVTGVRIEATPSKPRIIQNGLFVPLSPEPEKLELTLARIAAIVGPENVGSPLLKDTWERDRIEMMRWGELRRTSSPECREECVALRRFRPPQQATVQMKDDAPSWIAFSKLHGDIAFASGPWIGSGEWWNSRHWSREEWDVAVEPSTASSFTGGNSRFVLLRLCRDTQTLRWYAEGIFD